MNKIKTLFAFASGVAVGSAVTWKLLKTKYEQIAQEEIDSVKEAFFKAYNESEDCEETECSDGDEVEPETTMKYAAILQREGYTNYSDTAKESKESDELEDEPYVISPEEFGESDYTQIGLTYYSDGTLADENDEIVEDVEKYVGIESLSHFGEYEDDSVFVRNDRLKIDYEILLDTRKYSDIMNKRPYPREE